MPKTDINTILKNGSKTKVKIIDYTSPDQVNHLKEIKKKSETALRNKDVNVFKLSRFVINR